MGSEKVLPPLVCGKLSGHLTVRVDGLLWIRPNPGNVYVECKWWGDTESQIFRPVAISQRSTETEGETSVTYNIRTSLELFQVYLKNCGKLIFKIYKLSRKEYIGDAVVRNLHEVITNNKTHQCYYPIFSPEALRVGDLQISFELWMRKDKEGAVGNQEAKYVRIEDQDRAAEREKVVKEVVNQGERLRRAMVQSVLEDTSLDSIDKVINSRPTADPSGNQSTVVDFLLGKELTPEEEQLALKSLQQRSPSSSIIEAVHSSAGLQDESTLTCCCLKCNPSSNCISRCLSSRCEKFKHPMNKNVKSYKTQNLLQLVNCFKVTLQCLHLNSEGHKKITGVPANKSSPKKKSTRAGLFYCVEHVPGGKDAQGEEKPWKLKQTRYVSRKVIGSEIIFGESDSYVESLDEFSWPEVIRRLVGTRFRVYWREMRQRVPSLLGVAEVGENSVSPAGLLTSLTLPVLTNNGAHVAHLTLVLQLGHNKKTFGSELMSYPSKSEENEDSEICECEYCCGVSDPVSSCVAGSQPSRVQSACGKLSHASRPQSTQLPSNPSCVSRPDSRVKLSKGVQTPETRPPSRVTPSSLSERREPEEKTAEVEKSTKHVSTKDQQTETDRTEQTVKCKTCTDERRYEKGDYYYPCRQYCCERGAPTLYDPHMVEPRTLLHTPPLYSSPIIHEISLCINRIAGFPLFTQSDEHEMDCFIDYMFPITKNNQLVCNGVRGATEVMPASKEVSFAAVSRHTLSLPPSTSMTRAFNSHPVPSIDLYLWGRHHKSSSYPDSLSTHFMLAKIILPIGRICRLELLFSEDGSATPVGDCVRLPLLSVASPAPKQFKMAGFAEISLTYRNYPVEGHQQQSRTQMMELPRTETGRERNHSQPYFHSQDMGGATLSRNCENRGLPRQFGPGEIEVDMSGGLGKNTMRRPWHDTHGTDHYQDRHIQFAGEPIRPEEPLVERNRGGMAGCRVQKMQGDTCRMGSEPLMKHTVSSGPVKEGPGFYQQRDPLLAQDEPTGSHYQGPVSRESVREVFTSSLASKSHLGNQFQPETSKGYRDQDKFKPNEDEASIEAVSASLYRAQREPMKPVKKTVDQALSPIVELSGSLDRDVWTGAERDRKNDEIATDVSVGSRTGPLEWDSSLDSDLPCPNLVQVESSSDFADSVAAAAPSPLDVAPSHFGTCVPRSDYDFYLKTSQDDDTLKSVSSVHSSSKESLIAFRKPNRKHCHKKHKSEKATQTFKSGQDSTASTKPPPAVSNSGLFKAEVAIERAINLPMIKNAEGLLGSPTCYASFDAFLDGKPQHFVSPIVSSNQNPVWQASWRVWLPVDFLFKCEQKFLVRVVCLAEDERGVTNLPAGLAQEVAIGGGEDNSGATGWLERAPGVRRTEASVHRCIPRGYHALLDLTPLGAGLPAILGWFALSTHCSGQIKLSVTPLENISKFKQRWFQEYTGFKMASTNSKSPEKPDKKKEAGEGDSSSLTLSLKEKLVELESLTANLLKKDGVKKAKCTENPVGGHQAEKISGHTEESTSRDWLTKEKSCSSGQDNRWCQTETEDISRARGDGADVRNIPVITRETSCPKVTSGLSRSHASSQPEPLLKPGSSQSRNPLSGSSLCADDDSLDLSPRRPVHHRQYSPLFSDIRDDHPDYLLIEEASNELDRILFELNSGR